MVEFWYKKRDLKKCPNGHKISEELPDNPYISHFIKWHYGTHVVQIKDPKWRMKRWAVECFPCKIINQLNKPSPLFDMISKEYKGTKLNMSIEINKK